MPDLHVVERAIKKGIRADDINGRRPTETPDFTPSSKIQSSIRNINDRDRTGTGSCIEGTDVDGCSAIDQSSRIAAAIGDIEVVIDGCCSASNFKYTVSIPFMGNICASVDL